MKPLEFTSYMNWLAMNYPGWKFDVTNPLQISIWYERFKMLDSVEMNYVVHKFSETHRYPPVSPLDLQDVIVKCLRERMPNSYDAMHRLVSIAATRKGWDQPYDYNEHPEEFLRQLPDGAMKNAFIELESDFRLAGYEPFSDEFLISKFSKAYLQYAEDEVLQRTAELLKTEHPLTAFLTEEEVRMIQEENAIASGKGRKQLKGE